MSFDELYHFLFETYAGMGVLMGAVLVVSIIVCIVLERRTKRLFRDRGPAGADEWSLFGGDEEDEEGDSDDHDDR